MTVDTRPRTADNLPHPDWRRHPAMLMSGRPLAWGALAYLVVFAGGVVLLTGEVRGLWLGIGIFVGGWIFTAIMDNRSRAEQHTFKLMLNTRFDANFIKSMRETSRFLRQHSGTITKELAKEICNETEDGHNLTVRQSIGSVLNIYEIIAISIYFRDADEFLLREYYNGLVLSHYEQLLPMIGEWRKGDPENFVYFEWLAKRWRDNDEI